MPITALKFNTAVALAFDPIKHPERPTGEALAGHEAILTEFGRLLHPNLIDIQERNNGVQVFCKHAHYSFTMYERGVLRVSSKTDQHKFYPINV